MDPHGIKRALVVGAGVMGHAIAQVFAQAGIDVDLVDVDEGALTRAMSLMPSNLATLAEFGWVPDAQIPEIVARIHPSTDLATAATRAGFVMEAVDEVPEIKGGVFSQLDEFCPPDTILASTTSSLDIFKIARIKRPERLVVAHWFAPPHIIPLVEVVGGSDTASPAVTATAELMRRLGKRPLVMKQFIPAFIVNRIQNGIAWAVWEMLEQGWATPEQIDLAVKTSLGIRLPVVGVVQTVDFTGLDVVADIMRSRGAVTPLIEEKVKQGHLGAKTSKGLYDYGGRSEAEILQKRDRRYIKMLEHLEGIEAFDPI